METGELQPLVDRARRAAASRWRSSSAPVMDAVSPVRSSSADRRARRAAGDRRSTAVRGADAAGRHRRRRAGSGQPRRDRARRRSRRRDRRGRRRRVGRSVRLEGAARIDGQRAAAADRRRRHRRRRRSPTRARHGCRIVATVPRGGRPLFDADLTGPVAMLIGGEGRGPAGGARRRRRRARHDPDAGAGRVAERRGGRGAAAVRSAASADRLDDTERGT